MYTIILFGRTMVNQKVEESVLKSKLMAGRTKLRVVRVLASCSSTAALGYGPKPSALAFCGCASSPATSSNRITRLNFHSVE